MKRTACLALLLALLGLVWASAPLSPDPVGASRAGMPLSAPLPKPKNISCQGYNRDTAFVYWQDAATDDTNYRVERSIAGGAWTEIATVSPDSKGYYGGYSDSGADPSKQDRRYRVRAYRASDTSYSPYSDECTNRRLYDPDNFFIFYGLRNTTDLCPKLDGHEVCLSNVNTASGVNTYVSQLNSALQGSVDGFVRVGFDRRADAPTGTPQKVPINVIACDGGGCAYGDSVALSPDMLETPFNTTTRAGDPVAWLVPLHEMFHFQQAKYPGLSDPSEDWAFEAQARSIQDKICIGANRSTAQCFDDIDTGDANYVGEVRYYLGNPNYPILQYSYTAALFWTYLTEKYGTAPTNDSVEGGMNLIVEFWKEAAAHTGRDGVAVLNSVLTTLGHTQRFRDIWKDFAVANYAKDLTGSGVPARYKYADMAQPGGSYGPVALSLDRALGAGEALVDSDETVYAWGARYYQLRPAATVPTIAISVTQDSTAQLYYTVLGVKGNDLAYEYNLEARNLAHTVVNNGYDKVVLIVAGLDNLANYRYAVNGTQPTLHILSPTTANVARVGSNTAPDKFRVTLEVLRADGTTMPGVSLSDFSFQVGTQGVPTASILSAATIMGQQWFILRAPAQSAAARYDLQVTYSSLVSATEVQAVDYTPRTDADNMLLIDKSGSMGASGKMDAAKAAARLFVDSWQTGDQIGVVTFNETPALSMPLTAWSDTSRQNAFNAINALAAGGGTNIGDTLRLGWDQLKAHGSSAHDWSLVLLSDGDERDSTPVESFDYMMHVFRTTTERHPVVNTVAVGPDADRPRMQRVAADTGGSYQYVSLSSFPANSVKLNIDYRFRSIAASTLGLQPFYVQVGPLADGLPNVDDLYIPVASGAGELTLSLSWDNAVASWEGVLHDPANAHVAEFKHDSRHSVWRVAYPAGGNWRLEVTQVNPPGTEYLVDANLRSDLTMEAYLVVPPDERKPGVPMPILVSLTDTGPIAGAGVAATVDTPSGPPLGLFFYDDGRHDDGAADDGLYGATFYQTGQRGSYSVLIGAAGHSTVHGNFMRYQMLAFHLLSDADYPPDPEHPNPAADDTDGDGLSNEWEQRYSRCVNPLVPDGGADPDNDRFTNLQEQAAGTDPCNPDSDGGGEADGTDPNPLNPSDDAIQPTRLAAYAGIGKVFIRYAPRVEYRWVDVFRADNPNGPFAYYDEYVADATGVVTDTGVSNGQTYCYTVIGQDNAGRISGSLMPGCATPKADPWPPHGTVSINGGASATGCRNVTLSLWASDAVEPEYVSPATRMMLPPTDSASGVQDVLIGNQPDLSDGVWQPYRPTQAWTLTQPEGLAAVFARFRDGAGNLSTVAVATIHFVPGQCPQYMPMILHN
jgi:Mg-chelatase subunit ChlD